MTIDQTSGLSGSRWESLGWTKHPRTDERGVLVRNLQTGRIAMALAGSVASVPQGWAQREAERLSGSDTWSPAEVREWVQRHGGNVTALARRLRVHRTRLQGWMSDSPTARSIPAYVVAHMETLDTVARHQEDQT